MHNDVPRARGTCPCKGKAELGDDPAARSGRGKPGMPGDVRAPPTGGIIDPGAVFGHRDGTRDGMPSAPVMKHALELHRSLPTGMAKVRDGVTSRTFPRW